MDSDNLDSELGNYVKHARESGAVRIRTEEGDFFVVAPRQRTAGVPAPFDGAGKLLESPLKRAAYSDRTAWLMAALSQLAYSPFETGGDALHGFTASLADAGLLFHGYFHDPNTGTQAFIARRPDEFTVLVFRGTEKDRKDIVTDLNARFYKTPSGKAHQGFLTAYESVHQEIVSALRDLQKNNDLNRLFIAGHSLGGALATAAACKLEKEFLVAACYTYGSPRVGTSEWSDAVKTPVYRVVNGADGVPLVPPGTVMRKVLSGIPKLPFMDWLEAPMKRLLRLGYAGFQHAGDLRFLKDGADGARLKIGSVAAWERIKHVVWKKFIIGGLKKLNPKALSAAFADHSISDYERKLRKIAEDRNLAHRIEG